MTFYSPWSVASFHGQAHIPISYGANTQFIIPSTCVIRSQNASSIQFINISGNAWLSKCHHGEQENVIQRLVRKHINFSFLYLLSCFSTHQMSERKDFLKWAHCFWIGVAMQFLFFLCNQNVLVGPDSHGIAPRSSVFLLERGVNWHIL